MRLPCTYYGCTMLAIIFVAANSESSKMEPVRLTTNSSVFKFIAKETYSKVLPCLQSGWMFKDKRRNYTYPSSVDGDSFVPNEGEAHYIFPDDAEEHYAEIMRKTRKYRTNNFMSNLEYAGYKGPWLENIFIRRFYSRPLNTFNGLFPLFIQWVDFRGRMTHNATEVYQTIDKLRTFLRPDVLYFTVSFGDLGLGQISVEFPNILVFSAGGFGHVPIPLIKGLQAIQMEPTTYKYDISFFGRLSQRRTEFLRVISNETNVLGMKYQQGQDANWLPEMGATKFNLCPRGAGRASFRLTETVQIGRIPIFIYDDVPWIAYHGTEIGVDSIGYVGYHIPEKQNLTDLIRKLKNVTKIEYKSKMDLLQRARRWYTYNGVFAQLDLFFQDPFGEKGGFLRCAEQIPVTFRCCDFNTGTDLRQG